MSSQKTRHQKLNSYWVMNSLGDNLSAQQRYPHQSYCFGMSCLSLHGFNTKTDFIKFFVGQ